MYTNLCNLPPVDWNEFDDIKKMQNENHKAGILYFKIYWASRFIISKSEMLVICEIENRKP